LLDVDEPAVPTDFRFEPPFTLLAHLCEQIGGLMRNERERSQFESDDDGMLITMQFEHDD